MTELKPVDFTWYRSRNRFEYIRRPAIRDTTLSPGLLLSSSSPAKDYMSVNKRLSELCKPLSGILVHLYVLRTDAE